MALKTIVASNVAPRPSHSIVRYAFVYIMRLTGHTHDRESPIQNKSCLELNGGTNSLKSIASSKKALISLTLDGLECCKSCTRETNKVGADFSWFGWPDWPRNVSAQFFGRSGKVLYGAFSIVGMASQTHNVDKGIPDDRVARSMWHRT